MEYQDKNQWEQKLRQTISGLEEPYRQPLLEIIQAYVRAIEIKEAKTHEANVCKIPVEVKKKAVERMEELRKEVVLPEDFDPDRELYEAILEKRRPSHKVMEVAALPEFRLRVQFEDETTKEYDVKPLFSKIKSFRWLEQNPDAFAKVTVDTGGRGIIWNDDLDLSGDELWEHGKQENHESSSDETQVLSMEDACSRRRERLRLGNFPHCKAMEDMLVETQIEFSIDVARRMLQDGKKPMDFIGEVTELPIEKIQEIRRELDAEESSGEEPSGRASSEQGGRTI